MFNLMCKCTHRQSDHADGGLGWCRCRGCICFTFREDANPQPSSIAEQSGSEEES